MTVLQQARANRAVMTVDLAAIRQNIDAIKEMPSAGKIMPIIKGDAYGIGAVDIALDLQVSGHAQAFGVDNVYEGILLRQAGVTLPVLVLDGGVEANIVYALQHDLMPGISTPELLAAYNREAAARDRTLSIWLYYNCGFNRSGRSDLKFFTELVKTALGCSHIRVEAVYSHLTDSNSDPAYTSMQVQRYQQALDIAREHIGGSLESSLYASHGIVMCQNQPTYDWARPGILLYGMHCFSETIAREFTPRIEKLRLAIELKARLINKIDFDEDAFFAYGQNNRIFKGERLGTVAIGFGNGIRQNSGEAHYAFNKTKLPLYGCVGMDYSQVKLPSNMDIPLYEWVNVFGDIHQGALSPEVFASRTNQSPYSLIRCLNVARQYINPFRS